MTHELLVLPENMEALRDVAIEEGIVIFVHKHGEGFVAEICGPLGAFFCVATTLEAATLTVFARWRVAALQRFAAAS